MKSLTVYLKEYKKESILAPLFKLLEVVFDLLVPVVVAQIIDVGVAQDNRSYVVQMFFVLILMGESDLPAVSPHSFLLRRQAVDLRQN